MDKLITLSGRITSTRDSIISLISNLSQLDTYWQKTYDKVYVNMENVEYIDSNISILVFAYIKHITEKFKTKCLIKYPKDKKVMTVLSKNKFTSLTGEVAQFDDFNTFIPIVCFKNLNECAEKTLKLLISQLKNINMSDGELFRFLSSLLEINYNAFQHAECDSIYLCGQFYPNSHMLILTYINFGITFKQNFLEYLSRTKNIIDKKPIEWAIINEHSTAESAGVGLTQFFDLIKLYNADVIIYSDNEIYQTNNNKTTDEYTQSRFSGCLMNIKFNLNANNCIK